MDWLRYVLLGFAPGLAWLWYLRRKDRFEPEPRALVLRVFVYGALTPWLVLSLRPWFESMLPEEIGTTRLLIDAFLVTALFEEAVKALALVAGIGFHRELDEPLDGIVYGGAAALGFASVENVIYLVAYDEGGVIPRLIFERAFTSTLLHLACTAAFGFWLARARMLRRGRDFGAMALAFALVVLLHGVYDALLFSGGVAARVALAGVLPIVLLLLVLLMRRGMRQSQECAEGAIAADGVQGAASLPSSDLIQSTSPRPNPREL